MLQQIDALPISSGFGLFQSLGHVPQEAQPRHVSGIDLAIYDSELLPVGLPTMSGLRMIALGWC